MSLTCEQAGELLTDLLAGEIAAEPAEALDAHLTECASCREQAARAVRLDRALAERSAHSRLSQTEAAIRQALAGGRPRPARVARRAGWLAGLTVVAAVVALAVAATIWLAQPTPAIARFVEVEGDVYVKVGDELVAAGVDQPITSSYGVQTVGEHSRAVVAYGDGTRIEIGPDSTISQLTEADADLGKRVLLTEGYLRADVAKQPSDRPMILSTPHARIMVKGTTLSLVNSPEATRVDLEEGKVEVTRRSDGQMVEVAAGSYSIVGPVPEPIAPRPLPPLNTKPRLQLPDNSGRVLCVAFAPDGQSLATGGRDGWVRVWDTRGVEREPMAYLAHAKNEVRALAYSPDGQWLASGGDENYTVKIGNPANGLVTTRLKGLRTWIEALAYTRDGRTFIVAGAHGSDSSKVKVWDLGGFRVLHTLTAHDGGVWGVALTPDDQLLVTGGRDRTAKLWGLATGQLLQTLAGHMGEVLCVAISPDGRTIATGSRDKTIKLWDIATGQEKVTLLGHAHDVRSVAFTPDGQSLVSGSMDGTARVWDLADFRERAIFKGVGGIWVVAVAPDGRTLAVAGDSNIVRLWDLP